MSEPSPEPPPVAFPEATGPEPPADFVNVVEAAHAAVPPPQAYVDSEARAAKAQVPPRAAKSQVSLSPAAPPTEEDFARAAEKAATAPPDDPFYFPPVGTPEPLENYEGELADSRAFKARMMGEEVEPGQVVPDYVDPVDAFLALDEKDELPTYKLPIPRLRTTLVFRALSTPHYTALVERFTTTRRDKETGERIEYTRDRELRCQAIIDSVENMNFMDERLYKRFKLRQPYDPYILIERMFLPGEVAQLYETVMRVSGGERLYLEDQAKGF